VLGLVSETSPLPPPPQERLPGGVTIQGIPRGGVPKGILPGDFPKGPLSLFLSCSTLLYSTLLYSTLLYSSIFHYFFFKTSSSAQGWVSPSHSPTMILSNHDPMGF
jgi:hypothetical protein